MAKRKKGQKNINQYEHTDKKRLNNPPVGLVSEKTDPTEHIKKKYQYDPHIDPQLQWASKTEHTSFVVPTKSLHVHERIDPKTIIDTVKKEDTGPFQPSLFQSEKKPLREAIEFYKHKEGWSNRMIAGDSLIIMNSLLEKEGMFGKVQMIYIDPPYGIKYGSNFQPFVNKREVKDKKDEDLTAEPEMIKAFRDTWELGIHSYLTYLRDRLLLSRDLLNESGSIFVQISDENIHHVRELLDEVFGKNNFISLIPFRKKTMPLGANYLDSMNDYILWYGKENEKLKYRQLYYFTSIEGDFHWKFYEIPDGSIKRMNSKELNDHSLLPKNIEIFRPVSMKAPGYSKENDFEIEIKGKSYSPPSGGSWITGKKGMNRLLKENRLFVEGNTVTYKLKYSDYPLSKITNFWGDTVGAYNKKYVVQTNEEVVKRCILMATDPGDIVFDPTCGSGTTAFVAEKWGRRWITCDTSRVSLFLAKQRLMTATFDYYKLAYPDEGVGSGFIYKKAQHITLKSIANNEPPKEETLYDQPIIDTNKARITGPFTIEAVPSMRAKSLEEIEKENQGDGISVARSGETLRQEQWREELLKTGVRGKGGKKLEFTRVEPLSGAKWIQCEAETKEDNPQKLFIVFGPEHAPLEQRIVENAWQEARPFSPDILLFAAFQFDDEAAKDIDELKPEITGIQLLKVQMNADLLTEDLKKKRSSSESFWLIGQPDVEIKILNKGSNKEKFQVEVLGFDYYNPITGNIESGGKQNIATWLLDTNYDDRSLFPSQVFFPMSGKKEGWNKLAKNLKAEIDEDKIKAFSGTVSLPFKKRDNAKIAVKIIDDRGIESLRVMPL